MTAFGPDQPAGGSAAGAGDPPAAPATGHARVDDLVAALEAAAHLPPADQIAPLTEADRVLRETLDSIGDI